MGKAKNKKNQPTRVMGPLDNFLENLRSVVDGIAFSSGEKCEVVLHDLRQPEHSIVAIANGHVTGRKVGGPIIGGPIDDNGLRAISEQSNNQNFVGNYISRTRDGRTLKSTTIFFRDSKGKLAIALCINLDLTEFRRAKELLSDICMVEEKRKRVKVEHVDRGKAGNDINAIISIIANEAAGGIQGPVRFAGKTEKIKVIKAMHERGLFLVKGGVDYAARHIGVSRFTVYNYLKELEYREESRQLPDKLR